MIEIERSFSTAEIKQIEASVGMGDIAARTNGAGQILVRARIRSNDEADLQTAVVDGVLKISQRRWGESREGTWFGAPQTIDLTLVLPAGADMPVMANTGKGDASFDGVLGACEIHTGKGDVAVSASSSAVVVQTGMGDVSIRNGRGGVRVETGKGDVAIDDLAGALQVRTGAGDVAVHRWHAPAPSSSGIRHAVRTGSGDVSISHAQIGALEVHTGRGDCSFGQLEAADLRVHTGSGDVSLEGDPAAGRWEARTGKGDISLRMPARPARIEASTRHGDISSDLPQIKVARPGPASQRGGRSIGVIGDEPRAEILLDTGHGDIAIRMIGAPAPAAATAEWAVAEAVPAAAAALSQAPTASPQADTKATALAILESLSRGELSVDEAEALLRSLDAA